VLRQRDLFGIKGHALRGTQRLNGLTLTAHPVKAADMLRQSGEDSVSQACITISLAAGFRISLRIVATLWAAPV